MTTIQVFLAVFGALMAHWVVKELTWLGVKYWAIKTLKKQYAQSLEMDLNAVLNAYNDNYVADDDDDSNDKKPTLQ